MHALYLITCVLTALVATGSGSKTSIEKTYQKGVEAYSGERWTECITQFEETLHLYKLHKSIVINCRIKCATQKHDPIVKDNIEDLKEYEKYFSIGNCIKSCQRTGLEAVQLEEDINKLILANINDRKPYEYLHVCYFQMYVLPKAASAAFTFLVTHPDNEEMKNNVKFYIEQPEVDVNEIVDFESEDFEVMHNVGTKSYLLKNYRETIAAMEESIVDYMSWENKCRVECERMPEQEWSINFILSVSNNIANLLQCRQKCQDKLKTMNYKSGIEYLADVLNYIQISYYHLDKLDDAAKAVASYLYLLPDDEDMLENKHIYSSHIKEDAFTERSDIVYYSKRDMYEKKLLDLFHEGNNNDITSNTIE